jgi:predicted methyltransferase
MWAWVLIAMVVIMGAGMGSGWVLRQYNDTLGFDAEAARIADVLQVKTGTNVGDIRAGSGKWSVDLARRVGASGQVYATVGPNPAHEIYQTLAEADVNNVTVITRTPANLPRLPIGCCEAILVRGVYHEFQDRARLAHSLYLNARPGARVAIIDFDEGTSEQQSGHGIAIQSPIKDMTAVGFVLTDTIEDWAGHAYCLVFTRPPDPVPDGVLR